MDELQSGNETDRSNVAVDEPNVRGLFTPTMLADLVNAPLNTIRRLQRHGLIQPVKQIKKLVYFDFQEVAIAKQLVEMLDSGSSIKSIQMNLRRLAYWLPQDDRPLVGQSLIVEGKDLLVRRGGGLVDPGGQTRLDFDQFEANETADSHSPTQTVPFAPSLDRGPELETPQQYKGLAESLEESDDIPGAIEAYRSMHLAFGPTADSCFQLAEWLYQIGELESASERYYVAIELDGNMVEARASLGCVLFEMNQVELAVSAFQGALELHSDYPDVHFHLARGLEASGRSQQAVVHWQRFIQLAPESPWADEARDRLNVQVETAARNDI